jgi:hypothetical protein
MKKLGVTLIGIVIAASIYANHTSKLIVELECNKNVVVFIDGYKYTNSSSVTEVNGITPGYHDVKIVTKPDYRMYRQKPVVLYRNQMFFNKNSVVRARINHFGEVEFRKGSHEVKRPVHVDDNVYSHVMNRHQFSSLLHQIEGESFDSGKLRLAKQALRSNNVSVRQVKALVREITFEGNKLDLAKYSYERTIDSHNYYMVADAFTFSSTKNSLYDYIGGY